MIAAGSERCWARCGSPACPSKALASSAPCPGPHPRGAVFRVLRRNIPFWLKSASCNFNLLIHPEAKRTPPPPPNGQSLQGWRAGPCSWGALCSPTTVKENISVCILKTKRQWSHPEAASFPTGWRVAQTTAGATLMLHDNPPPIQCHGHVVPPAHS